MMPSDSTIRLLRYGWGNLGYSASIEYLKAVAFHAKECDGPIFETGTGASTIMLSRILPDTGSLTSVEHIGSWALKVSKAAAKRSNVEILVCPLVNHGAFDWYASDCLHPTEPYKLVVCDGPPASTRGGRVGVVPVLHELLSPDAVILLDDADRPGERTAVEEWGRAGFTASMVPGKRPYAVLTRSGSDQLPT